MTGPGGPTPPRSDEPRTRRRHRSGRLRSGRLRATAGLVLAAGLGGGLLAGCGQSSGALGHQACVEVSRALRLYEAADRASSPATAASDRTRSLTDLRRALRPAAQAGSADGDWQALEATLAESSRVPEKYLVGALRAQCAATLSTGD